MNLDKAREVMHKLNSGVGRAKTLSAFRTELRDTPDGDPLGVERVDETELPVGYVGPASPCCEAEGEDEHTPECAVGHGGDIGDINDWLRRTIKDD